MQRTSEITQINQNFSSPSTVGNGGALHPIEVRFFKKTKSGGYICSPESRSNDLHAVIYFLAHFESALYDTLGNL